MQLEPRRAIITLVWDGCIIAAGPAIGYAQGASEHARLGPTVTGSEYSGVAFAAQPPSIAVRQDDNEGFDNDNVADNDNAFDDEDTADNENGNDNSGDFADEAEFLRAAVSDSATEIEAGRLAQDRTASEEVRQLAERMIREHEATMWEAASVAASNGVETQWQPSTAEEHQRLADLTGRSGDDFDRVYLQSMVWDQRSDIGAYESAKGGMRDNVAEYANNHLWMLEDQLRAARDLAELLSVDVD